MVSFAVTQAEGKRPAGGAASQQPEPGPSEEGGGGIGPQREASRLQEADPAGPEGGEAISITAVSFFVSLFTVADVVWFCLSPFEDLLYERGGEDTEAEAVRCREGQEAASE